MNLPSSLTLQILNQSQFDDRPRLPLEVKERWIAALKSGTYKQGQQKLNKDGKFCCLGVLCDIEGVPFEYGHYTFPDKERTAASLSRKFHSELGGLGYFKGFSINEYLTLSGLNDGGHSFEEIAAVIQELF